MFWTCITYHNSIVYSEEKKKTTPTSHRLYTFFIAHSFSLLKWLVLIQMYVRLEWILVLSCLVRQANQWKLYILALYTVLFSTYEPHKNQIEISNRCANIHKMNYDYEWINIANDCFSASEFGSSFFFLLFFFHPLFSWCVFNYHYSMNCIVGAPIQPVRHTKQHVIFKLKQIKSIIFISPTHKQNNYDFIIHNFCSVYTIW